MRRPLLVLIPVLFILGGALADAFFDEVLALREELKLWETTHAADFTDVIAQLDDITGPVFDDVSETDWFHPFVSTLAEWEIVSGYRDAEGRLLGKFVPEDAVTVAQALKMAMKAAKVDSESCAAASGIAAVQHWASAYLQCSATLRVRLLLEPAALDRPASRAEILTIVHDVFGDNVVPLYSTFEDTAGHVYESDIAFATLSGIVRGDTTQDGAERGTFRPDDAINRAETAKVIYERVKLDAVREGVL